MNREEVIKMAREAGFHVSGGFVMPPHEGHITETIERFAALVAEKERKECMDLCMGIEQTEPLTDRIGWEHGTVDCACAISRRGSNV